MKSKKKRTKRVLAFVLAFMMLLSTAMTSLAVEKEESAIEQYDEADSQILMETIKENVMDGEKEDIIDEIVPGEEENKEDTYIEDDTKKETIINDEENGETSEREFLVDEDEDEEKTKLPEEEFDENSENILGVQLLNEKVEYKLYSIDNHNLQDKDDQTHIAYTYYVNDREPGVALFMSKKDELGNWQFLTMDDEEDIEYFVNNVIAISSNEDIVNSESIYFSEIGSNGDGIPVLYYDFLVEKLGTTTITFRGTDGSGIEGTLTLDLTVSEGESPHWAPDDLEWYIDDAGDCWLTWTNIQGVDPNQYDVVIECFAYDENGNCVNKETSWELLKYITEERLQGDKVKTWGFGNFFDKKAYSYGFRVAYVYGIGPEYVPDSWFSDEYIADCPRNGSSVGAVDASTVTFEGNTIVFKGIDNSNINMYQLAFANAGFSFGEHAGDDNYVRADFDFSNHLYRLNGEMELNIIPVADLNKAMSGEPVTIYAYFDDELGKWTIFEGEARNYNWYLVDEKWRCKDQYGVDFINSWAKSGNDIYWLGEDGYLVTESFIEYEGDLYYVNDSGKMARSYWYKLLSPDDHQFYWYSFRNNGKAFTDGRYKINEKFYYFNKKSQMQIGLIYDEKGTYYAIPTERGAESGRLATEEFVTIDGNIYYFDIFSKMVKNTTKIIDDVEYVFDANGVCQNPQILLYTITWKNWDDTVLETDINVQEGTIPQYDGKTPTKPDSGSYYYTFKSWTPAITTVTTDAIYTATYTSHEKGGGGDSSSSGVGGGSSSGGGGGGGGSASGPANGPGSGAPAYSPRWQKHADGKWFITRTNGTVVTNAWLCDDVIASNGKKVWYLLQADGTMLTAGLVQDKTGNCYSMEMDPHNQHYGMLRYKSGYYNCNGQQIYLELEENNISSLGAIKNADAIAKLKSIYGLTTYPIGNETATYTSNF